MPHRKYRALEQECRIQAAITGNKKTKEELKEMEREYKVTADRIELRQQADRQAPPEE